MTIWVWEVTFSPDGRTLASIGVDSMLRISPLVDGAQAQGPVFAHTQRGRALDFDPAGELLATAGDDGAVRIWDPADLSHSPSVLDGHTGIVRAVAFSPGGRQLASVGDDGTLRVWTARLLELQQAACARAARELSAEEWQRYLPYTPAHKICPISEP